MGILPGEALDPNPSFLETDWNTFLHFLLDLGFHLSPEILHPNSLPCIYLWFRNLVEAILSSAYCRRLGIISGKE